MAFKARTTLPANNNKYYIRKADGGYSPCIKGNPQHEHLTALSNCVSWVVGRFNEIGEYGSCKYLGSWNPDTFPKHIAAQGLKIESLPTLGAVMLWKDHCAIVEKVVSASEVMVSESAYGGYTFRNKTYKNGLTGNWGRSKAFIGFIPNPAVPMQKKLIVGCKCQIIGKARNYSGKTLSSWCYGYTFYVKQIVGDRVVIGKLKNGKISTTAAMRYKDLKAVE